MIAFDFEYYKPSTIDEAINLYNELTSHNKSVMYYSGGTEFISRARRHEINTQAIIDLKGIQQCTQLEQSDGKITIGSAVTLSEVQDLDIFPLLTKVVRQIATRTERNKITIGGNLSSHLIYREALLPFLLADSEIVLARKDGVTNYKAAEIFNKGFQLKDDEFIVSIITDEQVTTYPYVHHRKTKHSAINYPIVSLAALKQNEHLHIACSGVGNFPFALSIAQEMTFDNILNMLPTAILDDMHASKSYRTFVLKNIITKTLTTLKGVAE